MTIPNIPHDATLDLKAATFVDQLMPELSLAADPQARVLLELGKEIDRLGDLLESHRTIPLRHSVLINGSAKRAELLNKIYILIKDRQATGSPTSTVNQVVAKVVLSLESVMKGNGVHPDLTQNIISALLEKLEAKTPTIQPFEGIGDEE